MTRTNTDTSSNPTTEQRASIEEIITAIKDCTEEELHTLFLFVCSQI